MQSLIDLSEYTPWTAPLIPPQEFTPILSDVVIQTREAITSTQNALSESRALDARNVNSPLLTPERPLGSIVSATA